MKRVLSYTVAHKGDAKNGVFGSPLKLNDNDLTNINV